MGTVTDFESRNRTAKAHRLAMAAIRRAHEAMPAATNAELAEAARRMPYRWWVDLADAEGIRSPSTATVAAAVAILTAEAERPEPEGDPFSVPGGW